MSDLLENEKCVLAVYGPADGQDDTNTQIRFMFSLGGYDNQRLAFLLIGMFRAIEQHNQWPENLILRSLSWAYGQRSETTVTKLPSPN